MLLVGHSFLTRLIRATDITEEGVNVDTVVRGGAYIRGSRSLLKDVEDRLSRESGKYGVIVFQLGSNDIDRANNQRVMVDIVQEYVARVGSMCARHGILGVLCTEIPRGEGRFPFSYEKTSHFNTLLQELGGRCPDLSVFRHKGMHKREGYLLLDDDIHFNWENGMVRYFCSFKRAMRQGSLGAWGSL